MGARLACALPGDYSPPPFCPPIANCAKPKPDSIWSWLRQRSVP